MSTHIAVLDDELDVVRMLSRYLSSHGYRVTECLTKDELLAVMHKDPPHLVLLDLGLPGEDGFAIARHLREQYRCGVIIVTGRGDSVDKVVGLEVGADDYVTKPFDLRELEARVKAVLRRTESLPEPATPPAISDRDTTPQRHKLYFDEWIIDVAARSLEHASGRSIELTGGEFDLLVALARHPGRVLSRDFLLESTRRREANPFDRTIDVQIGRLRRKIEPDPNNPTIIKSVRGSGYLFAPTVSRR